MVRRGLADWAVGSRITGVQVLHPRPVRNHLAGPGDFADRLRDRWIVGAERRGKYLWLPLGDQPGDPDQDGDPHQDGAHEDGADEDGAHEALLVHLGMSGQMVLQPPDAAPERHLRVVLNLAGSAEGRQLRFVDQRMFGGLQLVDLVPTADGLAPYRVPVPVAHIARDLLDEHLDLPGVVRRIRGRSSGVKRVLLDQQVVSGIGNIYADEALFRARLHYDRPSNTLAPKVIREVLGAATEVMRDALAAGGTSFDSLYVDVNGQSGYFERELYAYGREGEPCLRCGAPMVREPFMNRSSFRCPRCQRAPRTRTQGRTGGLGRAGNVSHAARG